VAEELASYFDKAADGVEGAVTPEEEVDNALTLQPSLYSEIEKPEWDKRSTILKAGLRAGAAAYLEAMLERQRKDVEALPLEAFLSSVTFHAYNPLGIAKETGAPLERVLRRLATLNEAGGNGPTAAFIQANAAGQVLFRKSLPEFPIPRYGASCSLWPLFQALTQAGRPIVSQISLPNGQGFQSIAFARATNPLDEQGRNYETFMLVIPLSEAKRFGIALSPGAPEPVGTTCRLCPRTRCHARAAPQLLEQNDLVASGDGRG
jgi:predicted transcriptional regulator